MSDMPASALLGMLVPKLPFLMKTAFLNTFSMSENAGKWDLRTELTIAILRSELSKSPPPSITEQQRNTTKIPQVKGPMWVAAATFPAPPEDDIRQDLLATVDALLETDTTVTFAVPDLLPVSGEWHGSRAGVTATTPEPPGLSDAEKYANLMKETRSDAVVLYFHGGAYYLMDAASQRPTTTRYAEMLGNGRTFAVRYRLAPQNAFPAALLDALVAYVSLIHPPPGALHAPVPAHRIVLAGDSAGGNLAAVLMQMLLEWHRRASPPPTLRWHGQDVDVPLPGAMALSSPWTDLTRALPSQQRNARFDYLPHPPSPPSDADGKDGTPGKADGAGTATATKDITATYPPCEAWPTNPPRTHIYADASILLHPLASPAVPRATWAGCPPTLFVVGEEMMADEAAVVAARMARQGVKVRWAQWEAMPHCFALVMEAGEAARAQRAVWGEWVRKALDEPEALSAVEGEFYGARSLASRKVDVGRLAEGLGDERVLELMRAAQRRLVREGEGDAKAAEETPVV